MFNIHKAGGGGLSESLTGGKQLSLDPTLDQMLSEHLAVTFDY